MKHLRQTMAIAENTARELVRNPAFLVLVAFGAALTALSPAFALFHMGEQMKLVADLGLGTVLVVGLLVGILGASWALTEELESLSVMAVLAKPVSRTTFLLGKYLGVLAAAVTAMLALGATLLFTLRALQGDGPLFVVTGLAALVLAAAGALLFVKLGMPLGRAGVAAVAISAAALVCVIGSGGTLALMGRPVPGWSWQILPALVGSVLQVAVLSGIAVALATRLTVAANLPIVFAVFILGQLTGEARAAGGVAGAFAMLLPDLGALQFSDAVARHLSEGPAAAGSPVPASVLAGAAVVAILYTAAALTVGAALFRRRDMT